MGGKRGVVWGERGAGGKRENLSWFRGCQTEQCLRSHRNVYKSSHHYRSHIALPSRLRGYLCHTIQTNKVNPFTPESDQCQNSPAASQEIWHHTVWRTWLFIAYSDEKWLYYKFSLHHSYNRFLKGWENTLFELRSERVNKSNKHTHPNRHQHQHPPRVGPLSVPKSYREPSGWPPPP